MPVPRFVLASPTLGARLSSGLVVAFLTIAAAAGGCASGSPELRVLGVHAEPRRDVMFVQVTNPASRPMRLTKLEYTFAAGSTKLSAGEIALARDIPAGAAVVVEIPVELPGEGPPEKPMTLSGKLTAELNHIVEIFSVSAQINSPGSHVAPDLLESKSTR